MKRNVLLKMVLVCFGWLLLIAALAQEKVAVDSVPGKATQTLQLEKEKRHFKNTLSVNVTNPTIISSGFITVGYERRLDKNQSFMVQAGSFSIPRFTESLADSLGLNTDYKDHGFHISADYRFYLQKENKYDAPRGVYLGPYYAYNFLNREINWFLDGKNFNGSVNTNLKLYMHAIGLEIGYQFVFWDRMSVDLILAGPGLGYYNLKTVLNTTMSIDEESEFFDKLNGYLQTLLPGYDRIIDAGEFKRTGSFDSVDIAFRYSVRLGYRF